MPTRRLCGLVGASDSGTLGTIEQDDIGRAFVAECIGNIAATAGLWYLENGR